MSWVKPALKIAGEVLPVAAVYAEKLFSEDSVPKFFSLDLKMAAWAVMGLQAVAGLIDKGGVSKN